MRSTKFSVKRSGGKATWTWISRLFLSGGVDSSLVSAVTRSLYPQRPLKAYTLRFEDESFDEGNFAESVATSLKLEPVPVWASGPLGVRRPAMGFGITFRRTGVLKLRQYNSAPSTVPGGLRMKKSLLLFALVSLFAANAFAASYWIVMKDGSQYECKQKWTVKDGKAWFTTVAGQTLTVDPGQIDVAKSEQATKYNGGAVIAGAANQTTTNAAPQEGLGSQIKLRKPASQVTPAGPPPAPAPTTPTTTGVHRPRRTATHPPGRRRIGRGGAPEVRAGVRERRHFRAQSRLHQLAQHPRRGDRRQRGKSLQRHLGHRLPRGRDGGVPGVHIDMVELFMKTTTGGSAGRFQMTRDDAQAIESKQIEKSDYFVRKVIYCLATAERPPGRCCRTPRRRTRQFLR